MAKTASIRLSQVGEFGLIRIINRFLAKDKHKELIVGIGDDAAVLKAGRSEWLGVTTDALVESIHFDLACTDFRQIGWKALAVNLSDIAAMGGKPRWALISLVIRDGIGLESIREFYRGLRHCARTFGVVIVGGNVAKSRHEFSVSVTAMGDIKPSRLIRRRGARPGHILAVTGYPGLAATGLRVLTEGRQTSAFPMALRAWRRPVPRVQMMKRLLEAGILPSAGIDVSDGVASDLAHVAEASETGATVDMDRLPLHREVLRFADLTGTDPVDLAMSGGEDYELLLTFRPADFLRARKLLGRDLTAIGTVTAGRRLLGLRNGAKPTTIKRTGYTHF